MELKKVKLVYFSATYTTRRVLRGISAGIGVDTEEFDITQSLPVGGITAQEGDVFIFGAPVYAGRIPWQAADVFKSVSGRGVPAVAVCVYGNRDYDDALLELKDTVESNGFTVVAAGAFIARHSIFPKVGESRPDKSDERLIHDFGVRVGALLSGMESLSQAKPVEVKGNRPYRMPSAIPLKPTGNRHCNRCLTCVRLCPVQAISESNPQKTDKEKCISCGRCVVVCPQHARHFGGILYKMAGRKFVKAHAARKEPETF